MTASTRPLALASDVRTGIARADRTRRISRGGVSPLARRLARAAARGDSKTIIRALPLATFADVAAARESLYAAARRRIERLGWNDDIARSPAAAFLAGVATGIARGFERPDSLASADERAAFHDGANRGERAPEPAEGDERDGAEIRARIARGEPSYGPAGERVYY